MYNPVAGIWCAFPRIGMVGGPLGIRGSRFPTCRSKYTQPIRTSPVAYKKIDGGAMLVKSDLKRFGFVEDEKIIGPGVF